MLLWFAAAGLPVSPQTDPLATLDPFKELSEHELHTRWSHNADSPSQANTQEDNPHDPSPSLSSRLRELQSFSETSYVDVRLAGFSSDGEGEISLPEDTLQALLDATLHSERQHVLFPPHGEAHGLPVYRRFVYRVTTAPPGLIARVVRQISVYRKSDGSLPVRAVDSMVREDFERGRGSHITLYLLNPRLALAEGSTASSPNATRAHHRYIDDADGAECSVVSWVGSGRYMWVDLSAGPVAYGRTAQAEGVVNAHAIPSVGRLARVFGGKEEVARQLAVELAVFVKTSSRFLLAPPLAWRQEQPYTSVAVVIVVVRSPAPPTPALPLSPLPLSPHLPVRLATPPLPCAHALPTCGEISFAFDIRSAFLHHAHAHQPPPWSPYPLQLES